MSFLKKLASNPIVKYNPFTALPAAAVNYKSSKDAEKANASAIDAYSGNVASAEAAGAAQGIQRGQSYYGQTAEETGTNVQDIIKRRRALLDANDPALDNTRREADKEVAMARATGANAAQLAQIRSQSEGRVDRQKFENYNTALGNYQDIIGNVLGGQSELEMGYAQLGSASVETPVAEPKKGLLGKMGISVICGYLHEEGVVPITGDVLVRTNSYGALAKETDPMLYYGYLAWASRLVRFAQAYPWVRGLMVWVFTPWALEISGESSLHGRIVLGITRPFSRLVGRFCAKKK